MVLNSVPSVQIEVFVKMICYLHIFSFFVLKIFLLYFDVLKRGGTSMALEFVIEHRVFLISYLLTIVSSSSKLLSKNIFLLKIFCKSMRMLLDRPLIFRNQTFILALIPQKNLKHLSLCFLMFKLFLIIVDILVFHP